MKIPFFLLLPVAVLLATAQGAQARSYEIELLVFQNLVDNDGGEVWPVDYSEWYEQTRRERHAPDSGSVAVTWLPASAHRLEPQRGSLARSAGYRPLAYYAWRQPVADRNLAVPIRLPASEPHSRNGAWVDGSVEVALGRYLHLSLDLQLHTASVPGTVQADMLELEVPEFRIREQRRMRSAELHYFDHPRFGVIALITPYEPEPDTETAPADADQAQ
jgi:hypothetical protein